MQVGEANTYSTKERLSSPELDEYPGDGALQIIKECREAMDDSFAVTPLAAEFGSLLQQPEYAGCSLALADANKAHTFKARGGVVAVWDTVIENDTRRVAAVSAGNHAAGVALATDILGVECDIFVPATTPPEKIDNIRTLNAAATIHQLGASFEETQAMAEQWEQLQQASDAAPVFIHPYDNAVVAAGQGTLVDDLLAEKPDTKNIVLPVGGGGLLAGVLRRLRQLGREDIRVIGVEANGSDSLSKSLRAGHITEATLPNTRYGGSCVARTGSVALATCVDNPQLRLTTVSDTAVELFMQAYLHQNVGGHRLYEPTSLVAVVGLMNAVQSDSLLLDGETVVFGTGRNAKIPQLT